MRLFLAGQKQGECASLDSYYGISPTDSVEIQPIEDLNSSLTIYHMMLTSVND